MKLYVIVKNYNLLGLEKTVDELMIEGWNPVGGVCYDGERYCQSMIYKEGK